ncbi:MAG: hypothetical protein ACRCYU_06720 [Nocardioides sp.]
MLDRAATLRALDALAGVRTIGLLGVVAVICRLDLCWARRGRRVSAARSRATAPAEPAP